VRVSLILLALMASFTPNAMAEDAASRVDIQSGIVITPQPALANQRIDFSAVGTGTGALTYTWFIGGLTITGQAVFASYFEPGAYFGRLVVTDSTGASAEKFFRVYITGPSFDADLDGVPNSLETALGSNPNDPASKPADGQRERLVFTPKPFKITGDPTRAGNDSISGNFAYQRASSTAPTVMSFWVSGVVKVFDITTSGKRLIATPRSGSRNDKLTLKIKDNVLSGTATFKKGSFLDDINKNSIVDIKGVRVIDIYTTTDTELYGLNINLQTTTAKSGKFKASGTAEGTIPGR
jgi:hypothetical protein